MPGNTGMRVAHINKPSDMPLHGCTGQQQIDLVVVVPIPPQVLNAPQRRLPVCNRRVQVMLFPVLVDTEAFKVDVSARPKMGLYWARYVYWGFHA